MENKHKHLLQNPSQNGEHKDVNKSRRRALVASITAAGAAGLPSEWKRPVVDSILLPAHAQTSVTGTSSFTTQITTSFTTIAGIFCEDGEIVDQSVTTLSSGTNIIWTVDDDRTSFADCTDGFGGQTSTTATTGGFTFSGFASATTDVPTNGTFSSISSTFTDGTTSGTSSSFTTITSTA